VVFEISLYRRIQYLLDTVKDVEASYDVADSSLLSLSKNFFVVVSEFLDGDTVCGGDGVLFLKKKCGGVCVLVGFVLNSCYEEED
jgi:hypothetical protein